MNSLRNVFFMLSISLFLPSAYAAVALKGSNYLCSTASQMNLWDISGDNPLIRHQLLLSEQCWKPMKGMHVEVLDSVGKFSRVRYTGNGIVAYAYNSDLKKVQPEKAAVEEPKTTIVRTANKLTRVSSLTKEKEVMLMKGKPTVDMTFSAGSDSEIILTITKESLKTGLNLKVSNQQGGTLSKQSQPIL